jgi:4'-phosphopantetheinyl transferase
LTDIIKKFSGISEIREVSSDVILCLVNIGGLAENYFPGMSFTSPALPYEQFEKFFTDSLIMPNERFSKINAFKRQIEWCAGRLAFSILSQKFLKNIYEIKTDERGAPFIEALSNCVSISHSGDYAACIICLDADIAAAVDIESVKDFSDIKSFLKVGFPGEDQDLIANLPLSEVYRLWTLKECFLKLIGLGFGENLKNIRITESSFIYKGREFDGMQRDTFLLNNHFISVIYTGISVLKEIKNTEIAEV